VQTHQVLETMTPHEVRDVKVLQAVYCELGFCEQVLEADLCEWMRLMIEAEWFG